MFLIRLVWLSRKQSWDFNWWIKTITYYTSQIYKRLRFSDRENHLYIKLKYFFVSVTFLSFIFLGLTGILPVVILNAHISGILLIIHVTIAPLFVIALTITALVLSHSYQFDNRDWQLLRMFISRDKQDHFNYHLQTYLIKAYFWIFLLFSVPASLSIIVSMFPFIGTDGQTLMLTTHQYSTLVLLIITMLYVDFKLIAADSKKISAT